MIPEPNAVAPDDWDADEDGEWEAPLIKNADCEKYGCGEWKAPMISNPAYKGKWVARKIDNPNFFVDESPHEMTPIGGIVIELWTMQDGILFDNILIASEPAVASGLA